MISCNMLANPRPVGQIKLEILSIQCSASLEWTWYNPTYRESAILKCDIFIFRQDSRGSLNLEN